MRRRQAFAGLIALVTLGVVLLLGQGQKVNAAKLGAQVQDELHSLPYYLSTAQSDWLRIQASRLQVSGGS